MLERIATGRAIGKSHSNHIRGAECACREKCGDGGINAARNPDHALRETANAEFLAEESDQPVGRQRGVDLESRRTKNAAWRRYDFNTIAILDSRCCRRLRRDRKSTRLNSS